VGFPTGKVSEPVLLPPRLSATATESVQDVFEAPLSSVKLGVAVWALNVPGQLLVHE
jgi:hypothetical protein